MTGVLADLKVLDLSWGIAGPMAGMLLADHGAQVTKIEPPGGDPFRSLSGARVWHRGKRSAVLDLPAERDVLLALVADADVLLESYAPGTTERLGIDYETLRAHNPGLVYCSITGYGRDTRHADRPAYDALVAARTGMQWEQRGWRGGTIARMAGGAPNLPELEAPDGCWDGTDRPGPLFPYSTGPASRPRSSPPPGSAPRCTRVRSPAAGSGSRRRCSRACWSRRGVGGSAPSTRKRRATTRGSSTRARHAVCSSAPTGSGCANGCRTRRSRSAPRKATSFGSPTTRGHRVTTPLASPRIRRRSSSCTTTTRCSPTPTGSSPPTIGCGWRKRSASRCSRSALRKLRSPIPR